MFGTQPLQTRKAPKCLSGSWAAGRGEVRLKDASKEQGPPRRPLFTLTSTVSRLAHRGPTAVPRHRTLRTHARVGVDPSSAAGEAPEVVHSCGIRATRVPAQPSWGAPGVARARCDRRVVAEHAGVTLTTAIRGIGLLPRSAETATG